MANIGVGRGMCYCSVGGVYEQRKHDSDEMSAQTIVYSSRLGPRRSYVRVGKRSYIRVLGGEAVFAESCLGVRNRPQPSATVRNRPQPSA